LQGKGSLLKQELRDAGVEEGNLRIDAQGNLHPVAGIWFTKGFFFLGPTRGRGGREEV